MEQTSATMMLYLFQVFTGIAATVSLPLFLIYFQRFANISNLRTIWVFQFHVGLFLFPLENARCRGGLFFIQTFPVCYTIG